ncbi:MAG: sensor histidine kinase [Candidatus Cyclobacteriaceae bacterium M2_1C_046]
MVRKNFKVNIILRLLLISLLLAGFTYYLLVDINYIRSSYLIFFLLLAVWELFHYIDRVNRDLSTFFTSLLQNDFTTSFTEIKRGNSFQQLYRTINQITHRFKELSTQKEQQLIFHEMLVEHVKSGIVSFDKDEKIHLMNQSLQRLLRRPKLHYLNAFHNVDPELLNVMREIRSGENRMLKMKLQDRLLHLSIHSSEFYIGEDYFKILSIQDIKTELEVNEVETWQKLIRVLTHEIMNSVSPITSLTDTMLMMIKKNGMTPSVSENFIAGLEAIKVRSEGLQNFTQVYHKLTKIPKPEYKKINICQLLEKIVNLNRHFLEEKSITINVNCDNNIYAFVDPALLSQVILNLIKNAQDALEEGSGNKISIEVKQKTNLEIRVTDDGPGIPEDIIDQIFVPFFTTKPSGSGIGLALSRQIMHLHKGSLTVETEKGSGTSFILKL